ncbi:hypothetical protein FB567DRAFT_583130 [Paraphoma chrysanthemicola]|uniref:Uncharacterized protein n=1 Tax=Paraphoma chrysanthemicola TaxID=798071 RepID=A0A8K0QX49_9PLEO|nr:hypothetical protein FB567DRAFT_583130 [Paraphoma chrysanthemicola]
MPSHSASASKKRSGNWDNSYDENHRIKRARDTERQVDPPGNFSLDSGDNDDLAIMEALVDKHLDEEQAAQADKDSSDDEFEDVPLNTGATHAVLERAAGTGAGQSTHPRNIASSGDLGSGLNNHRNAENCPAKDRPKHTLSDEDKKKYRWMVDGYGNEVLTKAGSAKKEADAMSPEDRKAALEEKRRLKAEKDVKGYNEGTPENAPSAEDCHFDSDETIPEGDAYLDKGCVRRMIFTSDYIPSQHQFAHFIPSQSHDKPNFLNAIDKAHNWMYTQPNSEKRGKAGWNQAKYDNGRLPRHFILKMGAPNGFIGHADIMAARLKNLWRQFFRMRLRKSHLTIEIEIPYNSWGAKGYFKSFMNSILEMTDKNMFGHRLTVKLADAATDAWMTADLEDFYMKPVDIEVEWQKILGASNTRIGSSKIQALAKPGKVYEERQPYPDEIEAAIPRFKKEQEIMMEKDKESVEEAVSDIREFIRSVRQFEMSKDPSYLQEKTAPDTNTTDTAPQTTELNQSKSAQVEVTNATNNTSSVKEHPATMQPAQPLTVVHQEEVHQQRRSAPGHGTSPYAPQPNSAAVPDVIDLTFDEEDDKPSGSNVQKEHVVADHFPMPDTSLQDKWRGFPETIGVPAVNRKGKTSSIPRSGGVNVQPVATQHALHYAPARAHTRDFQSSHQQSSQTQDNASWNQASQPLIQPTEIMPHVETSHAAQPVQTNLTQPQVDRLEAYAMQTARSITLRAQQKDAWLHRDDPLYLEPWFEAERQSRWQRSFSATYKIVLENLLARHSGTTEVPAYQPIAHTAPHVDSADVTWNEYEYDENMTMEQLQAFADEVKQMQTDSQTRNLQEEHEVWSTLPQIMRPLSRVHPQAPQQAMQPPESTSRGKRKCSSGDVSGEIDLSKRRKL